MKNKLLAFGFVLLIFSVIIGILSLICLFPSIGQYFVYIIGSICIIYLFRESYKGMLKILNKKSHGRSSE
jgi:maltodextrin utilization protein YvdJ